MTPIRSWSHVQSTRPTAATKASGHKAGKMTAALRDRQLARLCDALDAYYVHT